MLGYKKVGGLHFCRIGRLGFSFYIAKPAPTRAAQKSRVVAKAQAHARAQEDAYQRACRRSWLYARLRGDVPAYYPDPYSETRHYEAACLAAVDRALNS